jgi:hypothetical protein
MARYTLTYTSVTATAFADTTALTDNNYNFFLQGGSSTQRILINELYMGGQVTSGLLTCIPVLARDSTVAATAAAGDTRNALMDGSATAPGTIAVFGNSATTDPQRSSTLHLLHPSFQPYGGVFRWQARHGEEIILVGNTASLGEVSLSSFTGTSAGCVSSGHCIYEIA